jgi:hypothetical protein
MVAYNRLTDAQVDSLRFASRVNVPNRAIADELEAYIIDEWDKLEHEFVNKYVRSFKGKCQRVFDRNGLPA